jgi:hypothetical protein
VPPVVFLSSAVELRKIDAAGHRSRRKNEQQMPDPHRPDGEG